MQRKEEPRGEAVGIERLKPEPHVERALATAVALAGGEPLAARDLIASALMVARDPKVTGAFSKLASMLEAERLVPSDAAPVTTGLSDEPPRFSLPLAASWDRALPFLEKGGVWGRDYITLALLATDDPSLLGVEDAYGASIDRLRDEWFAFVTRDENRRSVDEWRAWWSAAGVRVPVEPAPLRAGVSVVGSPPVIKGGPAAETTQAPSVPTPPPITPVSYVEGETPSAFADSARRASQNDSLDMKRQADILTALLVAEEVHPPLAIALLGDWGVGKSYFMQIMRETVAAAAGRGRPGSARSTTVLRTAQITFNAWHYVDSDLWATLASHIFNELAAELSPTQEYPLDARRSLRGAIASSKRSKLEARAALATAEESRKEAAKTLAAEETKRCKQVAEFERSRLLQAWTAALKVQVTEGKDKDGKDLVVDLATLRARAEAAARRLGVTAAIDTAEQAQQACGALQQLISRGSVLSRSLASDLSERPVWLWTRLIALLAAILLVPYGLTWLERLPEVPHGLFTRLLAPLLQLSAVAGSLVAWAGQGLKAALAATSYLERIHDETCKARQALGEPTTAELAIITEIGALDGEISKRQGEIVEAERRIAEAQTEIKRIEAGGLVYDFLSGRVRDSRYLDRLGLISVIRQDFEGLRKVLKDCAAMGHDPAAGDSPPGAEPEPQQAIERIVLYIDDLDRCPPKRVVEVLQAVHLLLAFDLFIVVVAVDARWLERSLNDAYNPDGESPGDLASAGSRYRFSAPNYLEKIFQIPFSLPAMGPDGYRKLVAAKLTSPRNLVEPAAPSGPPADAADKTGDENAAPTPAAPPSSATVPTAPPASDVVEQTEKRIEAMLLSEGETQFVEALFPFIGTPRLAVRLVNVYRLLRVRAASRQKGEFAAFIDPQAGQYRAVLLLLAITIGYADTASEILQRIPTTEGLTLDEWLATLRAEYAPAAPSPSDAVAHGPETEAAVRIATEGRASLLRAVEGIIGDVAQVRDALAENAAGPRLEQNLEPYHEWVGEVGQYSFRWRPLEDPR